MTNEMPILIGNHLRILRKRQGLPQDKFAELLGIGRPRYGDIELGKKNLTLRSVAKLAASLDMRPLDLICPDHFNAYLANTESRPAR